MSKNRKLRMEKESTLVSILIWMIVLGILGLERKRAELEEDLVSMDCQSLLARSWNLHKEEMLKKLTITKSRVSKSGHSRGNKVTGW